MVNVGREKSHTSESQHDADSKDSGTDYGGLRIETRFCPDEPADPFDTVSWDLRTATIKDEGGDVLFDAFFALNEFHRQNAVWVMNSATFKTVRKFKDADGNYIWERGFGDNPATLLGRPVRIAEGMPDIAANAYPIAVADWRAAYVLVPVGEMGVTLDPYTTPGQIKLYCRQRFGGKLLDSAAVKLIRCATS